MSSTAGARGEQWAANEAEGATNLEGVLRDHQGWSSLPGECCTPSSSSTTAPACDNDGLPRRRTRTFQHPEERVDPNGRVGEKHEGDCGDGQATFCTLEGSEEQTPPSRRVDGRVQGGSCLSSCDAATLKGKWESLGKDGRRRAGRPPRQLGVVAIIESDGPNREVEGLMFGHIVADELSLEEMLDLEIPHDEYYEGFEKYLKARYPNASEAVIEHARALEELLDVCIVTGFSFSCKKANLYRTRVQFVGSIVDRHWARTPTASYSGDQRFSCDRRRLGVAQVHRNGELGVSTPLCGIRVGPQEPHEVHGEDALPDG